MKLTDLVDRLIELELTKDSSDIPVYFENESGEMQLVDDVRFEAHYVALRGD